MSERVAEGREAFQPNRLLLAGQATPAISDLARPSAYYVRMDEGSTQSMREQPRRRGFAGAGRAQFGQGSASALSMKWSALHDAAETVAMIAGVEGKAMTPAARNFPMKVRDATSALRDLVDQGVEDLTAFMEPGLSALLAAHARGADPAPAARVLWEEFLLARNAMLALAPEETVGKTLRFT